MIKRLRDISISLKIAIATIVVVGAFFFVALFFLTNRVESELVGSTVGLLENNSAHQTDRAERLIIEIQSTIRALRGTPPFQGLVRAWANNGYDPVEESTSAQWVNRLSAIFKAEIEARDKLYNQLRFLDANGQEVVRVDNRDGGAYIVPLDQLQDKSDRNYFIEAQMLGDDEIYISPPELNREGVPPVIVEPYTPVVRYVIPVVSEIDATVAGYLVANINFDSLVESAIDTEIDTDTEVYIVSADGYFLVHPDATKTWGGPTNFDTGYGIDLEFDEKITAKILATSSGSIRTETDIYVFNKLFSGDIDVNQRWTVIERRSLIALFASVEKTISQTIAIAGFAFLIIALFIIVISKVLLLRLGALARAARQIAAGVFDVTVHISSNDEIGIVTNAFNDMSTQLKDTYGLLEAQIEEKTESLNSKIQQLEDSRSATINILEDIQEEKEKNEAILNSIGDGVIVVDRDVNVVLINRVAGELIGADPRETVGKPRSEFLEVFNEDTGILSEVVPLVLSGESEAYASRNMVMVFSDGRKIAIDETVAPLRNASGTIVGAVIVFRDVSHEREVDRAKTEFVSLASHQLRTPLSAINWFTELLFQSNEDNKLNEEQYEYLSEIDVSNKRMIQLVDSLLNVSRIELGTFAVEVDWVNVVGIFESAAKELQHVMEDKRIKYSLHVDSDDPRYILHDPQLVRMMAQNLLSNAVKYTPDEGTIDVHIRNCDVGEVIDSHAVVADGLYISITDNGYGIPLEQQSSIFKKLFRAENVLSKHVEGTGLGLYIVQQVIERGNGMIWFHSKEEEGTQFSVILPVEGIKDTNGGKRLEQ